MQTFTSASIVLPAINETHSFQKTVDLLLETCDADDLYELFIVLCKKTTPDCVRAAEAIRDSVRTVPVVIYYQQRPFIGAAMQEAFERVRGSHVVMMSTDLETDPRLVADMIRLEKKRPEGIVTASRWIKGGGFHGYSRLKYALNFVFQKALSLLFWTKLTDLTYAYRIFPTDLVKAIRWEEDKHPFFLETALKPLRLGVPFIEIPAVWVCRPEGESQNTFLWNFVYFRTEFHVRFMRKADIMKS